MLLATYEKRPLQPPVYGRSKVTMAGHLRRFYKNRHFCTANYERTAITGPATKLTPLQRNNRWQ